MRDRLILLPGWGLGVSPLEPLSAALRGLDERLQVQIEPLPVLDSSDLNEWLDELDATLPDNAWLGGWSLGGMLASELAARRGERCCGLLTLASNPCFVAHDAWPSAMPADTFDAFLAGCNADSHVTLKRFGLLCAKGGADPRGLSRLLVSGAPHTAPGLLMSGLELLAQLDTRDALLAYRGPQLHLFAGMDGLVPAEAAADLLALLPDVEIGLIEQAGHAFLLEDPHGVAGAIQAFLHECADD
ncbi:alpha/beta fold hydrolase [Pseudomonas sp. FP2309]|uniref:alpha/beta fold hydrolase n=1 Tax=Pseudomonas sp. FP2309 TaxID=2954091 RepID=UPI002733FF86|nr:alpha/beta fold hydrolase [Pseudomonas sp. FP2309]WLH68053.1 alpha/beta fold hydrolase [Pseudomonas sp. FP2309]